MDTADSSAVGLHAIRKACSDGRLPAPFGPAETLDRLSELSVAPGDRAARMGAALGNSRLTLALGAALPEEFIRIIRMLDQWNKRKPSEEKHQDAVLLVDGFGEVNVHTAMILMQYRDTGKLKMCRCPKCAQFYSGAEEA